MNTRQVIATLNWLASLCQDSERGFSVAAENIDNRGLKIILKSFARQRTQFAAELRNEVKRLGGKPRTRGSFLGFIHRGWIDIKEGMTIGNHNIEDAVLTECIRGETFALRMYQSALRTDLPPDVRQLVERQSEQVQAVGDEVKNLRGASGLRLVVRLFDQNEDVQKAIQALQAAGFSPDTIETQSWEQATNVYRSKTERGNMVAETLFAAALIGALLGTVVGLAAGLFSVMIPHMDFLIGGSHLRTVITLAIGGASAGAVLVGILGVLIATGVAEEDAYLYDDSVQHGKMLVKVRTDNGRAIEASDIMHRINVAARAQQAYP